MAMKPLKSCACSCTVDKAHWGHDTITKNDKIQLQQIENDLGGHMSYILNSLIGVI